MSMLRWTRGDGIVGTDEPMGVHPNEIPVEAYGSFEDGDIVILVTGTNGVPVDGDGRMGATPPVDFDGDGEPDELPEGGCERISVSGNIDLTKDYHGGNGMVMLLDEAGGGPYQTVEFVPIPKALVVRSHLPMIWECVKDSGIHADRCCL